MNNSDLKGNVRDYSSIEQLIVMVNINTLTGDGELVLAILFFLPKKIVEVLVRI